MKPEKNSGFDGAWTRASQNTSWVLLPTELRSHMLGAGQILVGSLFPIKEFDNK